MKGKLIRWNEDRGFGFITTPDVKGDVFIHISELKMMSRRPIVNDIILFDVVYDKGKKSKAINASIEGVSSKSSKPYKGRSKRNSLLSAVLFFSFLFICFFIAYKTYPSWSKNVAQALPVGMLEEDFSGFSCRGKQHCSQMSSCKEARFYLLNCPNVKIDGDNDGYPCERQLCN
ncbi:MAG: hypothetical protein BA863_10650 [Desulfovibrio sp. S3730MH75]|nr:MAG: hypothetical protein BA863_10650 [Desulfovibrio sp. S3730MH75]